MPDNDDSHNEMNGGGGPSRYDRRATLIYRIIGIALVAYLVHSFRGGIKTNQNGLASASEMMKNVVGMLLVIGANTIARKAANVSLY